MAPGMIPAGVCRNEGGCGERVGGWGEYLLVVAYSVWQPSPLILYFGE